MQTKAAIDTNILIKAFRHNEQIHRDITSLVSQKILVLCHDFNKVIIGEYRKNLGGETGFQKWYQRLQQIHGLHFCDGKLANKHCTKLSSLDCHEPPDHVFIAVAFNSDKVLISEDSDVGKGEKGSDPPHCDALEYLQNDMGLAIYDAKEACDQFWPS